MDYLWWTNEASNGFEHGNDYLNSYYNPNAFETQYEHISCNYYGDNHISGQCPHVSIMDYVEDDFDKVQANLHDNHEHSLS